MNFEFNFFLVMLPKSKRRRTRADNAAAAREKVAERPYRRPVGSGYSMTPVQSQPPSPALRHNWSMILMVDARNLNPSVVCQKLAQLIGDGKINERGTYAAASEVLVFRWETLKQTKTSLISIWKPRMYLVKHRCKEIRLSLETEPPALSNWILSLQSSPSSNKRTDIDSKISEDDFVLINFSPNQFRSLCDLMKE